MNALATIVGSSAMVATIALSFAASAEKAVPGSRRTAHALPAPAAMSPEVATPAGTIVELSFREQFDVFRTVASSLPVDAAMTPGDPTLHPFSSFVVESLDLAWLDVDSASVRALCDALVPLTWRLSTSFPESTMVWQQKAQVLANGYSRIGLGKESVEWLRVIDGVSDDPFVRARCRQLLVRQFAIAADTTSLLDLAESWSPQHATGEAGRAATRALLAGLHIAGQSEGIRRISERFPVASWYGRVYGALYARARGEVEEARQAATQFLIMARSDTQSRYSDALKLTALMLVADVDWETGLDSQSAREYELLERLDHPFVRAWAQFMLGSVAMYNQAYDDAAGRYGVLCGMQPQTIWSSLACTLEKHSELMMSLARRAGR